MSTARSRSRRPLSRTVHPCLSIFALFAALSVACGHRSADSPAASAPVVAPETGPSAKLHAAVARSRYDPPADGFLSDEQVEMYLRVREREQQDRHQPGGPPVPDVDLLAAHELHVNLKEFLWVKARVVEAKAAGAALLLLQQMGPIKRQAIARLEAQKAASQDPAEKARIEAQIAGLKAGEKRAAAEVTPAARHNAELLTRYAERLDDVEHRPSSHPTPAPAGGSTVT
jgi:hypothetical protein